MQILRSTQLPIRDRLSHTQGSACKTQSWEYFESNLNTYTAGKGWGWSKVSPASLWYMLKVVTRRGPTTLPDSDTGFLYRVFGFWQHLAKHCDITKCSSHPRTPCEREWALLKATFAMLCICHNHFRKCLRFRHFVFLEEQRLKASSSIARGCRRGWPTAFLSDWATLQFDRQWASFLRLQ